MTINKGLKRQETPMQEGKKLDHHSLQTINVGCLDTENAAAFLGISPELLRSLKSAHLIPFVQLKHKARILYPLTGLSLWLENNRPQVVGRGGQRHE